MLDRSPTSVTAAEHRLRWLLQGKPWTVTSARGEPFPQRLVRILSIDGGGIRGIIPGLILQRIEEQAGAPIADLFDIVAGTSTGGLLAMGLTTPKPGSSDRPRYAAKDIVEVYRRRGPEIFHRSRRYRLRSLDGLRRPKYPAQGLQRVLDELFGEARLSESVRQTLVTAYCTERRMPTVLSSAGAVQQRNPDVICAEAARATAAAPTYFPPSSCARRRPATPIRSTASRSSTEACSRTTRRCTPRTRQRRRTASARC
jgi:patatin-like phospholipase/acyl hydrolase